MYIDYINGEYKMLLFFYIDLRPMNIQLPFFQSSGIFVKCVLKIVAELLL